MKTSPCETFAHRKVSYLWTIWHHCWAPRHHVLVTSAMVSLVETLVLLLAVMVLRLPRSKCQLVVNCFHFWRSLQDLILLHIYGPSFCFKKQVTQIYSKQSNILGTWFFFAEWIENWNLQNLRSWNGRNGRRSSSHVTFQVVPLPCCWVTFSMLGNVDVWVTRKVALMWQLNLMASTPLEFTSLCMPFSCKHFSRAPRNSSRPILRIQPQWKLQLIMQQIMHGRSR